MKVIVAIERRVTVYTLYIDSIQKTTLGGGGGGGTSLLHVLGCSVNGVTEDRAYTHCVDILIDLLHLCSVYEPYLVIWCFKHSDQMEIIFGL